MLLKVYAAALQLAVLGVLAGSAAHGEVLSRTKPTLIAGRVAPSFDCTHAGSGREQLICADPELSDLDGRLARLYGERRARLSPQGARLLQASQREWLAFITTVCPSKPLVSIPGRDQKTCLKGQYADRLQELALVAQKRGPFLFNSLSHYAAEPATDLDGTVTGFSFQRVSYPQIDNANTPETVAWNLRSARALSKETECDSDGGDESLGYEIGYANAHLISVAWQQSTYCHGTPHGFWNVRAENAVLSPNSRPLAERDVFGPGTSWVAPLQARFWAALTKTGWRPPGNQPAGAIKRELEHKLVQPSQWLFTKDGLKVSFSSYEGGCYVCTPQPITLPWSTLKPLLPATSILP